MWKTMRDRIEEIVSDSLPDFDAIVARKVQDEVNRKWQVHIHAVGENDILVVPTGVPDVEFDGLIKSIEKFGIRGVIVADNVRIIRLE